MFGLFRTAKSQENFTNNIEDVKNPAEKQAEAEAARDVYRVGVTNDGRTTLTLVMGYNTMTLTLTPEACETLIRILRSTYTTQEENENVDA